MFFHACEMDQGLIIVDCLWWRRRENKDCWRIGRDPTTKHWKGLTVANNPERRNQKDHLTFAGFCGRDFNACLFWIDWTQRAKFLLNKKIFMKILYTFFVWLLRWLLFRFGLDAIRTPIEANSICAGVCLCIFAVRGFFEFISKILK